MKFNKRNESEKIPNYEGVDAYVETPELELVSVLMTSFVKDQFYRSESEVLTKLKELVSKVKNKKFIAQAAIYARTEFGMRSVTHVVAGELAHEVKGEAWMKNFFNKVVHRPDDIMEILTYYMHAYGKPIPNSMKKGLAMSFSKFNEYQLAKYRGEQGELKLLDAVNLLHPKPTKDNKKALEKLMSGKLKGKDTWEVKLTKAGQEAETEEEKAELKGKAWKDLIKEKKIGYFALLRNLRNILEQAPEVKKEALDLLTDKELIGKSLVLPFRFSTAVKQISDTATVKAINKAADISLSNVPKFKGKTVIMQDVSSSMEGRTMEIAALFAAVLFKANEADVIQFESQAEYKKGLNPDDSVLSLAEKLELSTGGTNLNDAYRILNKPYDRIIILSDMQNWVEGETPDEEFRDYKKKFKADPYIYSFDLAGYGTLQFPERKVYALAGFSEKVFDVMRFLEEDKNAMINVIKAVEL
jgi:hypothetical protein